MRTLIFLFILPLVVSCQDGKTVLDNNKGIMLNDFRILIDSDIEDFDILDKGKDSIYIYKKLYKTLDEAMLKPNMDVTIDKVEELLEIGYYQSTIDDNPAYDLGISITQKYIEKDIGSYYELKSVDNVDKNILETNWSKLKHTSLESQNTFFSKLIEEKKKYEKCCPEYIKQAFDFLRKNNTDFKKYDDLKVEPYIRKRFLIINYKIGDKIKQKTLLYYSSKDLENKNPIKYNMPLKTVKHDFNNDGIADRITIYKNSESQDNYKKEHSYLPLKIVKGQDINNFIDWGSNRGAILDIGNNCLADGFQKIVCKGKYFTIEQVFCSDYLYVKAYVTFIYNEIQDAFFLFKYGEEYTNRQNPDAVIPNKIWTQKDFGKIKFKEVTQDVIIKLRS